MEIKHNQVRILDKVFELMITKDEIRTRVIEMAWEISRKYKDKSPLFMPIMNGSFMYAADLVRACKFDSDMIFVNAKSYRGMQSEDLQIETIDTDIKGRHIIIVEDIIDTGKTMNGFINYLKTLEPESISITTMLMKPNALQFFDLPSDYVGYHIPNDFVIGYGLDYDGYGRTLPDIYQLVKEE